MRVAFAGGGTGGHIYPALGIDDALRSAFGALYERRFFGTSDGLEATFVTTMPLVFVPCAPLRRSVSWSTLRTIWRNASGIAVALRALLAYRPALLIATGGYVCFPVVAAARLLRLSGRLDCRIAVLEINVRPGLTNRLLAPLVDEAWITYPDSRRYFASNAQLTGTPVRASLLERIERSNAREAFGLHPDRTTIVVMGGSQGARSINDAIATLVTEFALPPEWQVLHVSGERDYAAMRDRQAVPAPGNVVRLVPYLPDPANAYAAADIVVARAGASTLAELAVTATPAILVPYPFAAENHQAVNAASFARDGAAVVLPDAELDAAALLTILGDCLTVEMRARMRAAAARLAPLGAASRIVDRVTALLEPRVARYPSQNEVAGD